MQKSQESTQDSLVLSPAQSDAPQGSSVELSPSNSSGGTYMWDEEGLEPLGELKSPLASFEDLEINSMVRPIIPIVLILILCRLFKSLIINFDSYVINSYLQKKKLISFCVCISYPQAKTVSEDKLFFLEKLFVVYMC